ncbi:MAG: TlyA family RNA methyltransferase [Actinomycetota bacterium]
MSRRRLDVELVERGLAGSEEESRRLVEGRRVVVAGAPAINPNMLVARGVDIRVEQPRRFASRGGDKLEAALTDLGVSAMGKRCLDVGAGSGGFTDCLLQRGAAEVVAIDVGYGQFDWRLRRDPRVRLLERMNVRTIPPAELGEGYEVVVADLSFISLVAVLDRLAEAAASGADMVLLVKPQFEAARDQVEQGGLVRDSQVWQETIARVVHALARRGFGTDRIVAARPRGARGNQEFFLRARRDLPTSDPGPLMRTALQTA